MEITRQTSKERVGVRTRYAAGADERIGVAALKEAAKKIPKLVKEKLDRI